MLAHNTNHEFNPWETESMVSYTAFPVDPRKPRRGVDVLFQMSPFKPKTGKRASIAKPQKPGVRFEDDWVLVDADSIPPAGDVPETKSLGDRSSRPPQQAALHACKTHAPKGIALAATTASKLPMPASDLKPPRPRPRSRRPSTPAKMLTKDNQLSRELSDTAFHRIYKKPLVHPFGRGNTNPSNDANYMRSFNSLAAETSSANVFPCVLRASGATSDEREPDDAPHQPADHSTHKRDTADDSDTEPVQDAMQKPQLAGACCGDQEALVSTNSNPPPPPPPPPSMFDLLAWDEPEQEAPRKPVRRVAFTPIPPQTRGTQVAAGKKTKRSAPISELFQM